MASDPPAPAARVARAGLSSHLPPLLRGRGLFYFDLVLIAAIVALDWMTPAGIVVGFLLCIPILLSSLSGSRKQVVATTAIAIVAWVLAAIFGHGPISPAAVWVSNRLLAFSALPASGALSVILLQRAGRAEAARDWAVANRDLGRLLNTLMAHDLRTPIILARQALEHVRLSAQSGRPIDDRLLSRVEERLDRSIRTLDTVLSLARQELGRDEPRKDHPHAPGVMTVVEEEVERLSAEAAAGGKTLEIRSELQEGVSTTNDVALREALRILLDNAVRYAVPGPIRVDVRREGEEVVVRVSDPGPGLTGHQTQFASGRESSGVGLELASALMSHVQGRLAVEEDGLEGTTISLRVRERGRLGPS